MRDRVRIWRILSVMSREHVEALERVYAEWRAGSFTRADIFDSQIEVTWYPTGMDTIGTSRGIDELGARFRRWLDVLGEVRFEPERFIDLGDQVLVLVTMHARARHSGIEVSGRYGHLWTLREGKAVRLEDADPDAVRNLELASRFVELGRKGDWERLELLADDVLYHPIAEITEAGERRGRDEFRRYMEDFFESEWAQGLSYGETTLRPHGDSVIVRIQLKARGRQSGLDFDARVFQVLTFSDGRIVRIHDFLDRDEAITAAGE